MSESSNATLSIKQIGVRVSELESELKGLQDELSRTREYLLQAAYAHKRSWPCPRCGRPMEGYAEGQHACLAIERENEVELTRTMLDLQVELAELLTIKAEQEQGFVYEKRALPAGILRELPEPLSLTDLQERKLQARQALMGMQGVNSEVSASA